MIRDLRRKVPQPDEALQTLLTQCERLHAQKPSDKNKLYSLHEPEVKCISKGKARLRYEFGPKVTVATANRSNWIVGVELCQGNPYDGHTLSSDMTTIEQTTGVPVTDAYVDKGYRGHDYQGTATVHIADSSTKKLSRAKKKRRKRRSAVEPKIGHLKSDNRMRRCFLKGLAGDAINAILAAAGSNLQKLLRAIGLRRFFGSSFASLQPLNQKQPKSAHNRSIMSSRNPRNPPRKQDDKRTLGGRGFFRDDYVTKLKTEH